jgi:hypothetical protein
VLLDRERQNVAFGGEVGTKLKNAGMPSHWVKLSRLRCSRRDEVVNSIALCGGAIDTL